LALSASALIAKVRPLQKSSDYRVLIIDDTVEPKRGKRIEGSCKSIYSNKEQRCISGINMVSLTYTDEHSTFQLDFSLRLNESRRHDLCDYQYRIALNLSCLHPLHHQQFATSGGQGIGFWVRKVSNVNETQLFIFKIRSLFCRQHLN
jgi:hypothetical protein